MRTGVYFFLRPFRTVRDAGYQHRSIALAEGLKELEIPVFSNIDYWRLQPDSARTLFSRHSSLKPEDCDIVVTEHVYIEDQKQLPPPFLARSRKYVAVLIDAADGWRTEAMPFYRRGCDLVLRCHYNTRFDYGPNVHPWAFGLTERIIKALENAAPVPMRRRALLFNSRMLHPVRKAAQTRFVPLVRRELQMDNRIDEGPPTDPYDRLMWEQSGRRHNPSYYSRLEESLACAAFGGYFVPSFSRSLDSLALRIAHKAASYLALQTGTVSQFDSWRFWESLAAGCATFHVDLERYGCRLPVMPVNGVHYIGVDLAHPHKAASRVTGGGLSLDHFGLQGRRWALDNYSPVPVAERFLEHVRQLQ